MGISSSYPPSRLTGLPITLHWIEQFGEDKKLKYSAEMSGDMPHKNLFNQVKNSGVFRTQSNIYNGIFLRNLYLQMFIEIATPFFKNIYLQRIKTAVHLNTHGNQKDHSTVT